MATAEQQIIESEITGDYAIYNGDCVEVVSGIPDNSVGYSVFSPPFAEMYAYSDSERDMGNSRDYGQFFKQFGFLVEQLQRVMMPGRVVSAHCIDIPAMKERDGYIGIKDFPGDIIRLFQENDFIYHSRHCIWKDPLTEATRTKALGLMHKQLCKDSTRCRSGLPDYVVSFRKKGDNELPVSHPDGLMEYAGAVDPGGVGVKRSHNIWRQYANPVWMDIRQGNTLNKAIAREDKDQKHICPLQLDVIERCITLWSREGDVVLSPFAGIGSELYVAIKRHRMAVGVELKTAYYNVAVANCKKAVDERAHGQNLLFD